MALIVIGPEKLPRVARTLGSMLGKAQRYISDVKAEVNRTMDLDELKKMKESMESAARDVEGSVQTTAIDFEKQWNETTEGLTTETNHTPWEPPPPVYKHPGKKFRLIKLIPGGTTAGIFNIKTEYESKFGTLQPNKKVWVRLVTFNNDSHKCCVAMGSSELVGSIKG